jgi:hypothetical protein
MVDDVIGTRGGVASKGVVPTRIGRQQFTDGREEVPKQLHEFPHHVSISFRDIAPFMPPSQQWYKAHHNAVSAGMTAYLQAVCADLGSRIRDICWFNQLPYTLSSGEQLSHSSGALSPECFLSLSLSFPIFSVEALFLVLEHEQLAAAINDAVAPAHPELDALCDKNGSILSKPRFGAAPEAPNAHALDRLKVFFCLHPVLIMMQQV